MSFNPILHKVRTPIEFINIAGAGGLQLGSMIEPWGNPKAGKSTFCYQCAELFLEDYKDKALVLIIDAENSANLLRLRKVFNLDPCNIGSATSESDNRVYLEPGMTIELANAAIQKYMKKAQDENKYLFVIWDSITASAPQAEFDALEESIKKLANKDEIKNKDLAKEFAGGMMLKPRVIRSTLNSILTRMWQQPVIIFIINQATTAITRFGSKEDSSGGYGFKHNIHYRIRFSYKKDLHAEGFIKKGTQSVVDFGKTKHMPSLKEFPIIIHDDIGGKIIQGAELPIIATEMEWIKSNGGYFKLSPELRERFPKDHDFREDKNRRFKTIIQDLDFKKIIRKAFVDYFRDNFQLVNWEYEELEVLAKQEKKEKRGKKK